MTPGNAVFAPAADGKGGVRPARAGRRADRPGAHRCRLDRALHVEPLATPTTPLLPVPARGREGARRRSSLAARRLAARARARRPRPPASGCSARSARRPRLRGRGSRSSLSPALARVVRRDLALVPRAERRRRRLGTGAGRCSRRGCTPTRCPCSPCCSVLVALGWGAVRDWLADVEDYAAATLRPRLPDPPRRRRCPLGRDAADGRARAAAPASGSPSSRARLRSPPDPRRALSRRGSSSSTSDRAERTWNRNSSETLPAEPAPTRITRARVDRAARPAHRRRRGRLGDPPAVPADAAAPARPGLLVAR